MYCLVFIVNQRPNSSAVSHRHEVEYYSCSALLSGHCNKLKACQALTILILHSHRRCLASVQPLQYITLIFL